ncbi:MAG: GNAT family N-acetyltransferase [Clostridiales bacterium]|nr:GNAT family N-acetyltransferase [Clostridiales bacterium]
MKLDKVKIKQEIDKVSNDWNLSGNFILLKDGEILHNNHYGYANRELESPTKKDTKYTMDSNEMFFISLAVMVAIDEGKLKLSDSLREFFPEFKHRDKVTVEHLLRNESGLIDFYHEKLMVELEADATYLELSEHDRVRREKQVLYENRDFKKVYSLIESCDLDYEPGTKKNGSETNAVFLCEILKVVTDQEPFDYLKEHVFNPLNMSTVCRNQSHESLSYTVHKMTELVRMPIDYEVDGLFDVTVEDMLKLLVAFSKRKIISKKLWKKALKYNEEGRGIIFANANGFDCTNTTFLGYGFYSYMNHKTGVAFASLVNEDQTFKYIDNSWHYFRRDSRETVASVLTYPVDTKMIKLNKTNFWNAMNITIEEEQNSFVLDAKASVAMGLMYKTKKTFVQMEGNLVVGLLVLNVDKKKDDYNIDIIIIDKRFQNRGYGKHMVKWAVEYLKKEGAKTLTIGVSRQNIGAKKIYMNAGFVPKSVYDGGMELVMEF